MPQRLRRLERLYTDHPLYLVTACAHSRKHLLAKKPAHDAFIYFCEAGLERGVFVGRYVLMPDHLHLFVRFGKAFEEALIERKRLKKARSAAVADRRQSDDIVEAVCDRTAESLEITCLSSWMKSLKDSLSKSLNLAGHPAPHWQKEFFDHVMRSSDSYSEKWQYVVENPVRAGLVDDWEEWPWQGEIYPLMI